MPKKDFFPPRPDSHPMIYAYEDNNPLYRGLLKIGYTKHDVEKRVAQQYPTLRPGGKPYKIVFQESAMYTDGSSFMDHDIHRWLARQGYQRENGEWFRCTVKDVRAAWMAVRTRTGNEEHRTRDFGMRPEQEDAVTKTIAYFRSTEEETSSNIPKFLWNAKMRFGKTFASYELAKRMGFKRILVLTFKPAVESAWREDLVTHVDFEGWQFVSNKDAHDQAINIDEQYAQADKSRPIVVFGSFQDLLGTNANGGIKAKNEFIHTDNWDLVIFDEYHFGAWRGRARALFENPDDEAEFDAEKYQQEEAGNAVDETWLPVTTKYYLYLSGTPFRALNSGEFIEDQIYNWTYSDEQRSKENWTGENNPYRALPRMVMMTYKLPNSIEQIADQGEFNEFDLNVFFKAEGSGKDAHFKYEDYVQKWLDLIRGAYLETQVDELKQGAQRPPMPYSDARLLNVLTHTIWFLPNVASCFAMANLLAQKQNVFYHDYTVNVCAGTRAGIGLAALEPVQRSMKDPLASKTITLTCGKLTTGVTVKPWSAIFMLRNLKSPETYFQAAFRVQSPWEIDGEVMKEECYVFDFALNRALKQIADYGCRLNVNSGTSPEQKVEEFINFLPVIAYDGSSMKQISAADILDYAMSGTSATLLARRWESALLVNVDNDTLARLMANEEAMAALMRIEGFRSLNQDIETIINKSNKVKEARKKGDKLSDRKKKELTEEEKEYKSLRKQIQEKLIKFATRIPVFMYLTDYREQTLVDVITQLEPGLFKKVTGLDVHDFELLCSLNVFNADLMNDAIYKFKRYEDSSLSYTGVNKHEGEKIGLFNTVLNYDEMFVEQQASMTAPPVDEADLPENPFEYLTSEEEDEEEDLPDPEPVKEKKKKGKTGRNGEVIILRPAMQKAASPVEDYIVHQPVKPEAPKPTEAPKPVTPPPQAFDQSSVHVGTKVFHKAFGHGVVQTLEEKRMTVAFGEEVKPFIFPAAFLQKFLRVED